MGKVSVIENLPPLTDLKMAGPAMKQTVTSQAGEGLETSEEGKDSLTLVDKGVIDLQLLR